MQRTKPIICWLLLALFGGISAGGPGLHFAPLFGLHGSHSAACGTGCGELPSEKSQHACQFCASANSSPENVELLAGEPACHDDCLICRFYAQTADKEFRIAVPAVFACVARYVPREPHFRTLADILPNAVRGPPLG